jgi:hypothetical protein
MGREKRENGKRKREKRREKMGREFYLNKSIFCLKLLPK